MLLLLSVPVSALEERQHFDRSHALAGLVHTEVGPYPTLLVPHIVMSGAEQVVDVKLVQRLIVIDIDLAPKALRHASIRINDLAVPTVDRLAAGRRFGAGRLGEPVYRWLHSAKG